LAHCGLFLKAAKLEELIPFLKELKYHPSLWITGNASGLPNGVDHPISKLC